MVVTRAISIHSFIHCGARIGAYTKIGARVHVLPNAVIGADGFGFIPVDGKIEKIPQIGNVVIEDDVEIGAGTCIDRARFSSTRVGKGTKIDNLVQIGHNVKVKGYSGLIAQSGVAGSTEIGYGCLIWAQAGISGHIKIADGVQVGPQAGVPQSLDGSIKYVLGCPAESMKDFGGRVLVPKMLAKLKAEVKELKAQLAAK